MLAGRCLARSSLPLVGWQALPLTALLSSAASPLAAGKTYANCFLRTALPPSRRCAKSYDGLRLNVSTPGCLASRLALLLLQLASCIQVGHAEPQRAAQQAHAPACHASKPCVPCAHRCASVAPFRRSSHMTTSRPPACCRPRPPPSRSCAGELVHVLVSGPCCCWERRGQAQASDLEPRTRACVPLPPQAGPWTESCRHTSSAWMWRRAACARRARPAACRGARQTGWARCRSGPGPSSSPGSSRTCGSGWVAAAAAAGRRCGRTLGGATPCACPALGSLPWFADNPPSSLPAPQLAAMKEAARDDPRAWRDYKSPDNQTYWWNEARNESGAPRGCCLSLSCRLHACLCCTARS